MRKLGGPIVALLLGAGVALPVSANAAAISGAELRAGAVDAGLLRDVSGAGGSRAFPGVVLVQYNEGGGGGGGYNGGGGGYNQPYSGGGGNYNRPYNGGNNSFNSGAAIGAGAAVIFGIIRQHQIEEQNKQLQQHEQQQQYYNNQVQKRKYREELEHQHKFDIEKARLEEKRQEEIDDIKKQLNDEKKARLNQPQPNTPLPNPAYLPQPNTLPPAVDPEPYHDTVHNIVINIIPAPDNCPDNFQELRVGATVLYPRRTDFPADPSLCAGTTGKGCYLRVMTSPASCGGSRQICVALCSTLPPPAAPPKVVDIRPYVPPAPMPPIPPTQVVIPPPLPYPPPPVTCNGGNCPPPPVACSGGNCPPPPVTCNGGNCAPQINRTCTGGNCEPHFEPSQKPIKQASLTDESHKYVEPDHPKPIKKASLTDESHKYVEPDHPKPIKKASLTDESHEYVEPDHPKPIKKASLTDESHQYVEPDHPKPIKKASLTDESHKYVEPPHGTKPAAKTDIATTESAADLDSAELDSKGCLPNGALPVVAFPNNEQYQKLMQCVGGGCGPEASVSFDAPSTAQRSVALGGLSAIPKVSELGELSNTLKKVAKLGGGLVGKLPVGALVSGVAAILWPDPTPDALFDQMKTYVDKILPKAISDEHIQHLKNSVEGLKTAIDAYTEAKNLRYKGVLLGSLEQILNGIEPDFNDPRAPQQALAHFVAFATLKLTVLREEYLHANEYYGDDADHDLAACKLNNAVLKYTNAAKDIKQRAMDWRIKQIQFEWTRKTSGDPEHNWYSKAWDDFCDWDDTYHKVSDAYFGIHMRKMAIRDSYGKALDVLLAPLAHWASSTERASPALKEQDCHRLPPSRDESTSDTSDTSDISDIFKDLFVKQ
jgi:hypothetical protein